LKENWIDYYRIEEVDFFAIYVLEKKTWFILPSRVVLRLKSNIRVKPGMKKQKYSRYEEAWHLLRWSGRRRLGMGAEISFTSSQCAALAQAFPIPALRKGTRRTGYPLCCSASESKAGAIRPVTRPLGKSLGVTYGAPAAPIPARFTTLQLREGNDYELPRLSKG
jgi:hypothetical protein